MLAAGQDIDLMNMRSNVFPVRTSSARAEEVGADVTCRRCRSKPETLGHVLGECPVGREARIKRHDDIVDRIQKLAEEKGWAYAREKLFEGDDRPIRPDLVIITPGKAFVVAITVRFEQENSISEAAEEKTTKYRAILDSVKHDMGVEEVEIMPIVFGSRSGFPNATQRCLSKLGITSKYDWRQMMKEVLESTVSIARSHVDLG